VNDVGVLLCRYAPTFEDMYTQMEARQKERQNQMRDQASQGSVLDRVKQVRVQFSVHVRLPKHLRIPTQCCKHSGRGCREVKIVIKAV